MFAVQEHHDRHGGYCEQDACCAVDLSQNDRGDQRQDSRDTKRIAEHLRLDEVPVNRLQDDSQDQEIQGIHRTVKYQDDRTDHRAYDRTECRQQVRHADNDRYQRNIRYSEHHHHNGIDDTNDQTVQEVAPDI